MNTTTQSLKIIDYIGSCTSNDLHISNILNHKGSSFSYNKAKKMLFEYDQLMYYNLALNYFNPWHNKTKIVKYNNNVYLIIVHSAIEYIFQIDYL